MSTALIVTVMTMVTAANAEAGPVASTAAGIDVAYGISAAVAAVALIIAILKVRNVKKRIATAPAPQVGASGKTEAEAPVKATVAVAVACMEEATEGAGR